MFSSSKKSEGEQGNYFFFFLKDLYFDGFVSIVSAMSFPDLLWTKPEARIWSISNDRGFWSAFDWLFHPPFREASAKARIAIHLLNVIIMVFIQTTPKFHFGVNPN